MEKPPARVPAEARRDTLLPVELTRRGRATWSHANKEAQQIRGTGAGRGCLGLSKACQAAVQGVVVLRVGGLGAFLPRLTASCSWTEHMDRTDGPSKEEGWSQCWWASWHLVTASQPQRAGLTPSPATGWDHRSCLTQFSLLDGTGCGYEA